MSLYGDLPQAKDGSSASDAKRAWVPGGTKLMPTMRKPAATLVPPTALLRAGRGAGPPPGSAGRGAGAGRGPGPSPGGRGLASSATTAPGASSAPVVVSAMTFFTDADGAPVVDEYDPSKPNDYEEVCKERTARRLEAEAEAERQSQLRDAEQELERRRREQEAAAAAVLAMAKPPPGSSVFQQQQQQQNAPAALHGQQLAAGFHEGDVEEAAGPAPEQPGPQATPVDRDRFLKMSGEEAFLARAARSRPGAAAAAPPPAPADLPPPAATAVQPPTPVSSGGASSGPRGMSLAQQMLERMGWREGDGLGRSRQGITAPLLARKTAAQHGVIVAPPEAGRRAESWSGLAAEAGPAEKRARTGVTFNGPATQVLCLRNMVGPGEVDDDLEEEVGIELLKYGEVQDVLIFEVTAPGWPAEEAVRIFIKFDRAEAATRALIDLQGRFFGGRQVRAAFFSEERFDRQDLAPQAGEFSDA